VVKVEFIDGEWYDRQVYSNSQINESFLDANSPFQKYRISNVLGIYTPGEGESVVDLGCGWGTFLFAVAPFCRQVTGVDFSRKSISLCRDTALKRGVGNVRLVHASSCDTGLPSDSYDAIICADLFEHLYPHDFEATLDECDRILKRGGKLVIWTPNRGHIFEVLKNNNIILKKDPGHVDYKSMDRLVNALTDRGFVVRKNYYAESHIRGLDLIERKMMGLLPFMRRRIAILAEKPNA
jgi:cyclopropane fatty-acyl-phospholipid synthase-like methyltransferase